MLRGPSIFIGYFKNPKLTAETKTEDGWLHTGDIGQLITPGNALKIIDRIKNIFKLSQGEYIVSEKLERVYEQSAYIAQIFIHGDSLRNHIVAIAYPEFTTLKDFCIRNNLPHHDSLESILSNHNDQVMQLIEQDMNRLAEENKFNSLEKVKGNFRLVKNEFEVGTVLTPTMKLRRNEAKKYFADLIEEIYHKATEAERLL